jgi:hypothetical protein
MDFTDDLPAYPGAPRRTVPGATATKCLAVLLGVVSLLTMAVVGEREEKEREKKKPSPFSPRRGRSLTASLSHTISHPTGAALERVHDLVEGVRGD